MPDYAEEKLELMYQKMCLKIRRRREALGWSQNDLAQETGMSQACIQAIESGKSKNAGVKTLVRIAWTMGCIEEWLFNSEEK